MIGLMTSGEIDHQQVPQKHRSTPRPQHRLDYSTKWFGFGRRESVQDHTHYQAAIVAMERISKSNHRSTLRGSAYGQPCIPDSVLVAYPMICLPNIGTSLDFSCDAYNQHNPARVNSFHHPRRTTLAPSASLPRVR